MVELSHTKLKSLLVPSNAAADKKAKKIKQAVEDFDSNSSSNHGQT